MDKGSIIPKHKADLETAERLMDYRYEDIRTVVPDLLMWMQDMNWPVAGPVSRFLKTITRQITDELLLVLKGNDEEWKYWCLLSFFTDEKEIDNRIVSEIERIVEQPTKAEVEAEVYDIALVILSDFRGIKIENKFVIRIREWPGDHAKRAYDNQNYVEAIQVLHGFIETKLQELLILTGSVDFNQDSAETWDIANQISYINCSKVLFILGQLSQSEYQNVLQFNSLRNQVVHRLFHEPFNEGVKGIPRADYDRVFKLGIEMSGLLQRKSEEKIE
jgi:hypothetical protein